MMTRRHFVRSALGATLFGTIIGAWLGCAGYRLGTQTLYRPDIHTVHVPVFESDSFRPYLGERLTEAVAKEIELKTPYKVVSDINADSVLTGRIVRNRKRPIAENRNDEPRNIELGFLVEVTWRDRRGDSLGQSFSTPLFPSLLSFGQAVQFIPEGGQSISVAEYDAIARLAEQIVAQMEMPW